MENHAALVAIFGLGLSRKGSAVFHPAILLLAISEKMLDGGIAEKDMVVIMYVSFS